MNSSATSAAERIEYRCPQIGFAHQLQWYGQPRVETRFSEKRPWASVHAVRYASMSTRSRAGAPNTSG